jgi:hypothetical protein
MPYMDKFRDGNMGNYRELINQDRQRTSLTGFLWECCELRNSYVNNNKSLSLAKKKHKRQGYTEE